MEKIYLKGFDGPREWCTEDVNFKSYFDKYSSALYYAGLTGKKISEIDILQKIVPQSNSLSQAELNKLQELTDPAQLTNLSDKDIGKKWTIQSQPVPSTSFNHANKIAHKSLRGPKKQRNRLQTPNLRKRREVPVDPSQMAGPKDLVPKENYLVSFRVHEPFRQTRVNGRPSRCMQQILLLGHQPLVALRDKIICEWDYQDLSGELSENPDTPLQGINKDLYSSSMFYFGKTFYIDCRKRDNQDYSTTVKEWGKKKGLDFKGTQLMEEATVDDLEVRFGYPYLFLHQGMCEHMVIINDARLISKRDSLCSVDYPLMTKTIKQEVHYCMTCSRFPARWVVTDSDQLAHDPTYQCKTCFRMFNYTNGKKIGTFRAFRYIQRTFV